ncbi:MAG: aminoacyl-tRNA hydrolase [Candidatus Margulisiibacteriota bacterium]
MFLVVGLGNPGAEYADTRHNLGFRAVDELAVRLGLRSFKEKHQALLAETELAGHKLLLVKPQTFMNNSGLVVRAVAAWHKIEPAKVIAVYDDVDLAVGQLRLREKGSAGGHHGVESLIAQLGTAEFPRVRIGIGREDLAGDVSAYVLQRIPPAEREPLAAAVTAAAEAIEAILAHGLAAAMNQYNA